MAPQKHGFFLDKPENALPRAPTHLPYLYLVNIKKVYLAENGSKQLAYQDFIMSKDRFCYKTNNKDNLN